MSYKYLNLFLISSALIILDQYTKFMVNIHIPLNFSIKVIDGFFQLTHIRNPGVAFGLFAEHGSASRPWVFIIFSFVAIIAILVFFYHTPKENKLAQTALILIYSGAIGNLIDRIVYKEVVDFLDFFYKNYHWPAFNVADSCITIGVGLMVVDLFIHEKKHKAAQVQDES